MKKYLAILLCAVLVLSLFAGCGGDTGEPSQSNGTTEYIPRDTPDTKYHEPAANFAGGDGSEADPYRISNAAELALLNKLIVEEDQDDSFEDVYTNAYYILTADISLNDTTEFDGCTNSAPAYGWAPIGGNAAFCGVFDGKGHTISGMYINIDANLDDASNRSYGLFAGVRGTVKDLTIDQSYICVSGSAKDVGAVAGRITADDAMIENCVSNAVIETYGDGNVGGIVGSGRGNVANCQFGGSIDQLDQKWSHLGGISGYGCAIIGCTNLGTVSGCGYSGGIVGYGSQVTDSVNKGTVSGDTAGGITGNMFEAGTGIEPPVTELGLWNCVNEGTVNAVSYAGGIAGSIGNDEADVNMDVSGCENYGQVSCDAVAAGIIGKLYVERANMLNVENCVNHADITGKGKVSGIVCEILGGVTNQKGNVTISGCENQGSITSIEDMYAGGIVTYFMLMGSEIDLDLTVENCTNTGNITSQNYAGGIWCFSTSMTAADWDASGAAITLQNCNNSGSILGLSSNSYVGGIAAIQGLQNTPVLIDGCTNTGDVKIEFTLSDEEIKDMQGSNTFTLTQICGGIVGRVGRSPMLSSDVDEKDASNVNCADALTVIRNCTSTGTLSAPDYDFILNKNGEPIFVTCIGGIVGQCSGENGYSFQAVSCTFSGTARGLGNEEFPDVGQKK